MIIVITFIISAIAIVFQIWAYKSSSEPLETVADVFGATLLIPLMYLQQSRHIHKKTQK